jgi:hypothetical protein
MGIGERFGSKSSNRRTVYLLSSLVFVGAAAAAGFGGVLIFNDVDPHRRFSRGVFYGVIPNAFLNAYVYNRVNKPSTDVTSSRYSVAPYVTPHRAASAEVTALYGLSLSF